MNLKITSGKVIVSDPCYINDGNMGEVMSVPNGVYDVKLITMKVEGLGSGSYNKELVALAKGKSAGGVNWTRAGSIAVDSGTAGFFDSNVCDGMTEDDIEYWYDDEIIDLDGLTSLFNGNGCASETAMGDGGYDVFIAEDGGKIVGFKVVFLSELDIKYYNTPTLWSREGLLVYHSSNLNAPIYAVPKNKMQSLALVGIKKDDMFGVIDFDVNERKADGTKIKTELAKFSTPKDGRLAKLFRLSEDKNDISLPSGSFIFTDKEKLTKAGNDMNKLISVGDSKSTILGYIKFEAPTGTYSMAVDYDGGYVAAIRISRTK